MIIVPLPHRLVVLLYPLFWCFRQPFAREQRNFHGQSIVANTRFSFVVSRRPDPASVAFSDQEIWISCEVHRYNGGVVADGH
jgi:hypothetical protein